MNDPSQLDRPKDAYHNITSYRSVRQYTSQPVPGETVQRILQAGRWAGSAKNLQPWSFIVITSSATLDRLAGCGDFAEHLRGAPLAIAIVIDPVRKASFDAGRAAQNMMLAGWALGLGSSMATMHHQDCARQVLGVPPEKEVEIVLDFGYPAPAQRTNPGGPEHGRKSLDEIVHKEHW